MRRILLLLLFVPIFASAQHPAEADLKNLYTAFHDIDIDFLSERLCSKAEPTALYDQLDAYFLNPEQKFRYVFTNVKYNYGASKVIDGVTYQPVNFRNVVRITFFKPIEVASTQAMLKEKFAAQSVVYNKDRNAFMITYQAKLLAYSADKPTWKFAILDNTIPAEISKDCLPDAVKKDLGL